MRTARTGECCRGWDSPPSQPSPLKGEGVYRGQRGWVPACARTHVRGSVVGDGIHPHPNLLQGTARMGPRMREGMGFTPIPTFPPEGGRGLRMGPRMREDNGRGMGGCRADACLKLGMGVESQR